MNIQEIEARCKASTPAPWKAHHYRVLTDYPTFPIIELGTASYESNANFIAHARQDIPDLLEEVKRLRAALEAARLDLIQPIDPKQQAQNAYNVIMDALEIER